MASGTTNISGKKLIGNAQSSDVLFGQTFSNAEGNSNVGSMVNNGALNVSLAVNGNFTIPEGYHNGLGEVKQSILTKAATTYTPSTVNQTISAGKYLSGAQTILGDADLIAANIKAGKNIFGVAGNDNVVDTASGDAIASQILSGKKAYVQGALVTGTIPIAPTYPVENEAGQVHCYSSPPNAKEGNHNLFLQVPKGYYDNNWLGARVASLNEGNIKAGVVLGDDASITGTFTSDATATSGDILAGQSAYVNGNKVTGTIQSRGAVTITPGTANQTISDGQYLSGVQTILGDENLVDWKIRYGYTLFGVVGRSGAGEARSSKGNVSLSGTALNVYSNIPIAIAWLQNTTGSFVFNASVNPSVCYRVGSTETYPCSYTYPTFTITGLPYNMGMSQLYMVGKRLDGAF